MSSTVLTSRESLLSDRSAAVVAATSGVVAAHAEQITGRFYPRMFAEHPELSGKPSLQIGFGAGLVYGAQVVLLP